ncbi:MAG: serine O-acetyltransferase [Anaerolineales bacterium]
MKKDVYTFLLYARSWPLLGKLAYFLLKMLGAEIPRSVKIAPGCLLLHGGFGVVIHPKSVIDGNVRIYPGVTLGRADIQIPADQSRFEGIHICQGAILTSGAKILCKEGTLTVGQGTVIGANAVLLESTGENEIWAGIPARKIGNRE